MGMGSWPWAHLVCGEAWKVMVLLVCGSFVVGFDGYMVVCMYDSNFIVVCHGRIWFKYFSFNSI